MKRFIRFSSFLALASALFLMNSCSSDDTGTTFAIPPTIQFVDGVGFLSADATISSGEPIVVQLSAAKGDNPMNVIEFLQDQTRIDDVSRITIDGVTATSNAPLLIGDEADAFTWTVAIAPHATGTSTYTFSVADSENNASEVSLAITIEDAEPSISFIEDGTTVSTDAPAAVNVNVTAISNGVDLTTVSVWENGSLITDLSRLDFDGNSFTENPLPLTGDDVSGFVKFILIRQMGQELSEYTIQIENTAGKTAAGSFSINTVPAGTPVGATITGVLLENAAGADPTGGIDLYMGQTVSVNSPLANIIDLGNNNAGTAWLEQIGGANGATLRAISTAQVDAGFTLAGLEFLEEVRDAYDNSDALANNESAVVQVGDYFFVNVDNDYFALEVVEKGVNISGLGFYRFDIVQAEF